MKSQTSSCRRATSAPCVNMVPKPTNTTSTAASTPTTPQPADPQVSMFIRWEEKVG